ncbi:hypothetical protein NKDENANG_02806 [Candidatus Entotheonellaceae bacterium PAL068K]
MFVPFLEAESFHNLSHMYGAQLRTGSTILIRYLSAFERLVHLLAEPLFFRDLDEFSQPHTSSQSRHRPTLIVDDTKTETFGTSMGS